MRLTTTSEQAPGHKRTRSKLRLHGALPWPEDATAESLAKVPGRLIDVDAGASAVGGLPFRVVATLDLVAPDEIEDELLSSVLNERRDSLLREPALWHGGDRIWVRFDREGPASSDVNNIFLGAVSPAPILDALIVAAQTRLLLRRRQMSLRIREILIEDFGGIERLTVTPSPEQTTVLVGANGAGKTTLLTAAKLLLYQPASSFNRFPPMSLLRDDDIRNGRDFTRLGITVNLGTETVTWSIARSRGLDTAPEVRRPDLDAALDRLAIAIRDYRPVIVDYSVGRGVRGAVLLSERSEKALPEDPSRFRPFFEWFREREDLENETRIHDSAHRDPQLEAVRRAIPAFIPGFENLRVQRAPLRMLVTKGESTLYVDQLSDGEKGLLAMAGDLARRLAMANPYADDPLLGGGVVLIDEIELHLHPGWQRRVVPALERTFPNCQFILTTHSPAVLGYVARDSVFILEPGPEGIEIHHPDASKGADVSRILEDVLGTLARPDEFVEELDLLYQLLADGDTASARALYVKLAATLTFLDPALVRADVLLRRREAAGR